MGEGSPPRKVHPPEPPLSGRRCPDDRRDYRRTSKNLHRRENYEPPASRPIGFAPKPRNMETRPSHRKVRNALRSPPRSPTTSYVAESRRKARDDARRGLAVIPPNFGPRRGKREPAGFRLARDSFYK